MEIADPKALARLVKRLKKACAEDARGGRTPPTPRDLDALLDGTDKLLAMWDLANERLDQVREEAEAREAPPAVAALRTLPTVDELAAALRPHGPVIREADEWRPLAQHVLGLMRGAVAGRWR